MEYTTLGNLGRLVSEGYEQYMHLHDGWAWGVTDGMTNTAATELDPPTKPLSRASSPCS